MSASRGIGARSRDAAPDPSLPVLPNLFERIGEALAAQGRLGILSITVLERNAVDCTDGWHAYDRVVRTIARYLDRCRARRLRRDDRVFEPSLSGNAGLRSIAEIAPDFIKVDMTLVRDLDASAIKRELIATIRRFADATGIGMVAEGVKRVGELVSLMETGVRCAQGYLFARPDSPPRVPDWNSLGLDG
jgi:hypothetical protein